MLFILQKSKGMDSTAEHQALHILLALEHVGCRIEVYCGGDLKHRGSQNFSGTN